MNGLDPTSLAAWRERRVRVVELSDGLAVRIKVIDVLALLDGQGDAPNPLLGIAVGHTQGSEQEMGEALFNDPARVRALRTTLNEMLKRVVIEPPLVENGTAEGISVDDFSMEDKLAVFTALMGGAERLDAATRFREEPTSPVVAAPASEHLRTDAE